MASLEKIERWDEEADVVVLGLGLAGAVTAIEAYDTDPTAEILIVEKMPEQHAGGNSRVSGQGLFFTRDLENLLTYQRALSEPNPVPEDLLRAWAEALVEQEDWIDRMAREVGMEIVLFGDSAFELGPEFPDMPGAECMDSLATIRPAQPGAPTRNGRPYVNVTSSSTVYIMSDLQPSGVWNAFKAQVERRPIRVLYELRAFDLVQDPDTLEVFGVLVRKGEQTLAIKARRAVVLCTGGYEANLEMLRNYGGYEQLYAIGSPANTGDGLKMLQKAGAELWHLRNRTEAAGHPAVIKTPEYTAPFYRNPATTEWSWLDVAKDNRRFHDETEDTGAAHWKVKEHGSWVDAHHAFVLPVHMLFDEVTFSRTSVGDTSSPKGWSVVIDGYRWSPDNKAELERGWIVKADSIRALAQLIGRDPDEVEAAVARYNDACAAGFDPEFGRDPAKLRPIEKPPFYAVEIGAGLICTTGGGKRNARSQVLDHEGKPIPRLYEAGELGSMISNLYQGGLFLTEAMISGRFAGRNAVSEPSWVPQAVAV